MADAVLAESAPLAPAQSNAESKGIWRARLIEADVHGSSGFYPADVLRRDGAGAFPAGTHVYFDHPTSVEETDRPERSVLDLAGYLMDDARYEDGADGHGLFARIQFTKEARERVQSLAPVVGLSIRAAGEIEETSTGRVVRSIREGLSVDVVTRAGAGGRLVNMSESSTGTPTAGPEASVNREEAIPSSIGAGSLANEVGALKEALLDRMDQLSVDLARNTQQLKESQREVEKLTRDNKTLAETITFLRERQEEADAKISEAKGFGKRFAEILEANLPAPSMIRIAQTLHPEQDLHESITQEREYLKKVLRESERGALTRPVASSGLGITESAATTTDFSAPTPDELAEFEDVLSGKLF